MVDHDLDEEPAADCPSELCPDNPCNPWEQFWVRMDYVGWWTNGVRLPPLVTTSPLGTSQTEAGVLGEPGTTILFGDTTVGDQFRSGIWARAGAWLDRCGTWGLEGDYLAGFEQSGAYDSGPLADRPIVARPYFDVLPRDPNGQPIPGDVPRQAAQLISYPDLIEGRLRIDYHDFFQSAGIWGRYNLCCCDCDPCGSCWGSWAWRVDLIGGYRYYGLSDRIAFREDLVAGPLSPEPGTRFVIEDQFRARNDFHGGELGLVTQVVRGRWVLEVLTKVALGNNHQTVNVDGRTSITRPDQPTDTYEGGIYALRTNVGTYERDSFVVIPQLGVELGYRWTQHLRTFVGYNILYWGTVVRAADQIDVNLDTANFPPTVDPALPFPTFPGQSSSFWAQGINLGGELRF